MFPEGSEGSKAFSVVSASVEQIGALNGTKLTKRRETRQRGASQNLCRYDASEEQSVTWPLGR